MSIVSANADATFPTLLPVPTVDWQGVVGWRRALFGNQLQNMMRLGRAAGDIGGFRLPDAPVVIVNAPNLVDEVLVRQAARFGVFRRQGILHERLIGNGLTYADGDFHRRQRRLLAPTLQPGRIAQIAGMIAAQVEEARAGWANGATLDLAGEMLRLTKAIHGRTLFGRDLVAPDDVLGAAHQTLMECITAWTRSSPLGRALPQRGRRERMRRATATMNDEVFAMIRRRRAAEGDDDVLSLILRARYEDGGVMEEAQARDEVMTMLLAGYETVANAALWVWHLLMRHPEHYGRVQTEANAVLTGRTPGYDDLSRLPYALQVIKEAVRLYPTGGHVLRRALEDADIGGFRVPAETQIWIVPYVIHRDPRLFPDPDRFDPNRFTPEAERALPRHAYMPFGGGAHLCLGHHLAWMQLHLMIVTLAQRVRFAALSRPRVVPDMQVTLCPAHGLRVRVYHRD